MSGVIEKVAPNSRCSLIILILTLTCVGCQQGREIPEAIGPAASLSDVSSELTRLPETIRARSSGNLSDASRASPAPDATPVAVLEHDVFDFGTMDPFEMRQHTFTIRNEGTAPLTLRAGATSCKCTIGSVSDNKIAPGNEGTVTLHWRSGEGTRVFAHEAEILTNDLANPVLRVRVQGKILSQFVADPPRFTFPSVAPGERATASITLNSQIWQGFSVENLKTSLEGLTWELESAAPETLGRLRAISGQTLSVTVPGNLPRGHFSHWLRFDVRPDGESPRRFELSVEGKVLRRVAVYGSGIDDTGTIRMGVVGNKESTKKHFVVKVRDPEPELEIKRIETTPDFLQVQLQPYGIADKPGLYRLELKIPAGSPESAYLRRPGRLCIEFAHPRISELELSVEFAVQNRVALRTAGVPPRS